MQHIVKINIKYINILKQLKNNENKFLNIIQNE